LLAEDPLADLAPALFLDPKSGVAQSATAYYGRLRRQFLDRSLRRDFDYLRTVHAGDVGVAARSVDDRRWLVIFLDGGPMRYYAYDRSARRATFLFTENDAAAAFPLAERHAVVITTRDGLKLPADLYLPHGTITSGGEGYPRKPLPLLITVHGGPNIAYPWNSWFTNRMLQILANRGYAALRVEYRGAFGFGKQILNAGRQEWGRKMNDDMVDAANWAVRHGIADREKIGIWGWSYGGYATLAALAYTPTQFACGVALYAPTDLEAMLRDFGEPTHAWNRTGDLSTAAGRQKLHDQSPLFAVNAIARPLLLTQGGKDTIVHPYQADRFAEAMKAAGKPLTYLFYPDEPHDYNRPENWASFWAVAERFLHEHLGGRYEPPGHDLEHTSLEIRLGRELIPGLPPEGAVQGSTRP
jgi:dipeptidyl aminopeptidase/acylaminoacyl peptidase